MTVSDGDIIQQCLDGKVDEFRHLIQRYQTAVTAWLTMKLGNQTNAEEAAQETFVRAYFGLNTLKKHESFPSWLMGIANRVAKEQARKNMMFVDAEYLDKQQSPEQTDTGDYELQKAFALLPESHREILLLRFYANQSCRQIADNLKMPIGTVTKTLSRAYSQLRRLIEKENEVQI